MFALVSFGLALVLFISILLLLSAILCWSCSTLFLNFTVVTTKTLPQASGETLNLNFLACWNC